MVTGIDKFREYFAGHKDKYVVIGGTACDLLFNVAGLSFRATKDIDMVLCVEVVDKSFGEQLSAFLEAGGYRARQSSEGKKQFFRFHQPTDKAFPYMIELFSRKPEMLFLPDSAMISRIPVEEAVVSLSAILLEDAYFRALQSAKRIVNGVTILDETLLIPFKIRAFLDLVDRAADGGNVDNKHIRKHRNDIFRLLQLLPFNADITVPSPIREDLRRFLNLVNDDETLVPASFDVPLTRHEGIKLLRSAYGIPQDNESHSI